MTALPKLESQSRTATLHGTTADSIQARITNIRWRAEDSTWCIVQAVPTKGGKPFTIVGNIDQPTPGQEYEFEGVFSYNDRYNTNELRLHSYRTILPADTHGIEIYIARTARWAGPAVAAQMTKAFGKETLAVIKSDPARVAAAIPGITLERATEMQQSLVANEKMEKATIELHQMIGGAMPQSVAAKALKRWGSKAVAVVRRNPFRLTELPGVGFASADALWKSMQKPLDHPRRRCAAVLHVMNELHQQTGDTRLDQRVIVAKASQLVGLVDEAIFDQLAFAGAAAKINKGVWALADIATAERNIAMSFVAMEPRDENPPIRVNPEGLAADQLAAATMFEKSPVFILTGAPGTGKTYTTARLVDAIRGRGEVALCAPTGKAAKQMTVALAETCGGVAKTIHSLLMPDYDEEAKEFRFGHGPKNPIEASAIVIDEGSMLDVRLAWQLIGALRSGTRILIVGDRYQLPSVGPGSFLRDLIAAGVPSFELTEIKRNAGRIVLACHAIKDGRTPEPSPTLDLTTGDNWRHFEVADPANIAAVIEHLYREALPAMTLPDGKKLDMIWDVQAISPLNERGSLSCDPINKLIQSIVNPSRTIAEKLDFSEGDKVVRLKNGRVKGEYERDAGEDDDEDCHDDGGEVMIVNGDIGTVEEITKSTIVVRFVNPARRVEVPRRAHELKLAYCMTCHKMQGSEAPVVVLPLHSQFTRAPIWTREWIYTACSRAKKALITVGQMSAVAAAVRKVGNTARRTTLAELLRKR